MGIFSFTKKMAGTLKHCKSNPDPPKVKEFIKGINQVYKSYNLDSSTRREIKELQHDLKQLVGLDAVEKATGEMGIRMGAINTANKEWLFIKYRIRTKKVAGAVARLVREIDLYNRCETDEERDVHIKGESIVKTFWDREKMESEQANLASSVNSDRSKNLESISQSAQNLREQETTSPLRKSEEREIG